MKHLVQIAQTVELSSDQLSRAVLSAANSALGEYAYTNGKLLKLTEISHSRGTHAWIEVPEKSVFEARLKRIKAASLVKQNIDVMLGIEPVEM